MDISMDRNEKLKAPTWAKIFERLNRENTGPLGEDEMQNQRDNMRGNPTTVSHRIKTSVRSGMNGSAPVAVMGPFGGGGAAPASIPAPRALGTLLLEPSDLMSQRPIYTSIPPYDIAILPATFFSNIHYFKSLRPDRVPPVLGDEFPISAAPIADFDDIQSQWPSDAESDGGGAFIRAAAPFEGATS
ncbi:hypothetical protein CFIO01_06676 [Colletotrichum fioriniae PJ7]|uniref:Uncharacterized protein n=1 Tax=Colletotrichum fioriniae PJ7 TaxID=1445577 RepID=A0A010QG36_9PEZI|nr:hypothetical protein CFIO01_06676 [Colletotrichum fioriniae PJ7]